MKKRFPTKTLIFSALLFLICLSYFLSGAVLGEPVSVDASYRFGYFNEYNILDTTIYNRYASDNWTPYIGEFRLDDDDMIFVVDGIEYNPYSYWYEFPSSHTRGRKRYNCYDYKIKFETVNDILVSIEFPEDSAFNAIPHDEITNELVYSYIEKYCGTALQAVDGDIRTDYVLNDTALSWLYPENGEYEYTFVKYVCGKPTAYCIKVVLYETGQLKLIQNGYNSLPILKNDVKYIIPSWLMKNRMHTMFFITNAFMKENIKEAHKENLDNGYIIEDSYLYKDYLRGYSLITRITQDGNSSYVYFETNLNGLFWRVLIPSVLMLGCVAISTLKIIKWHKKSVPPQTEQEETE